MYNVTVGIQVQTVKDGRDIGTHGKGTVFNITVGIQVQSVKGLYTI